MEKLRKSSVQDENVAKEVIFSQKFQPSSEIKIY